MKTNKSALVLIPTLMFIGCTTHNMGVKPETSEKSKPSSNAENCTKTTITTKNPFTGKKTKTKTV